jgi:hypothetical protein
MESIGILPPSEEATEVVRAKTSIVWNLFYKDDVNDRAKQSMHIRREGERVH